MKLAKTDPRSAKSRSISAVNAAAGLLLAALAAFAAAPEAEAHVGNSHAGTTHTDSFSIYRRGHQLDNPRIVSRPASGDTYWPGETVTVLVPWGWANQASISVNSVGTVHLVLSVGNTTRTLTGKWEDRERRYGLGNTSFRRLYFDYVVRKGDRDSDGVSLAEDALSSPGRAESGIRGTSGTSFRQFELQKLLHGFGNQAGHKVDTPAPSFSGVSGPTVTLYTGGSVNYRLPKIANADEAYNVSYSVTPALPTGLALNTSTAAITGSHSSEAARGNYTLRATDGFGRRADLTFTLAVSADVGIESISITSNPGTDKTYGKNGDFGTNDTINVTVDFTHRLDTVLTDRLYLDIRIGSHTRRASNPTFDRTDSNRWDKLFFSYAVQEGDWDGDGISFPANPMGAGKIGGFRFHTAGRGGGDNRVNRNFGAVPDDPGHKVRGRQTTPTFGATASPSYSWIEDNAVSQQLQAATQGDGGVSYSIKEELPDGLAFDAATRTISGTPTAAQASANYTLVATDGDGDKAELRFSVEIQELRFSVSSPSVAEGAAGETATLDYDVTLNRTPGRQVTVAYAAATNPGTASSGTDYTAFAGGTLTFASAETSKTVTVTVTGDALDEPNETIRIALSNPDGAALGSASVGTGTITDDDPTPTLSLALSDPDPGRPDTIAESGAGNATTVTATLAGGTSGEAITVTVAAASVYAALAPDGGYSVSAARTLIIAAGATASTGTVTITATDDAIDSTDKSATVSGTVAGGHGLVAAPADLTLTIADDDAQPRSALALSPASITESGGVTTVTATLSNPSANAVTLTVAAAPGTGAAVGDYTLSPANTLTIAAGQTTSSGTVTVTAVGNTMDSADKSVTVSGTASGTPGAANPPDATLTILDDDGPPTVSLVLSSSSVSETGGVATVTASLNGTSSEAVTLTVAAAPGAGAAVGDYTLTGTTLTIAANATTSTGTVTITANDNAVDSPDKRVTVSGTASGGNGIADPASLTLTLADDEATPTVRLALSPASVAEANGVSAVTATLSGESSEAVTVTVSASPGAGTDYTLTGTTLTIAAGSMASTGTVTVTATPDTTDSADKQVSVSGTTSGGNGAEDPADATLTIVDDDALPTLSLALSASTIDESGAGNVTTVTAALSHPSGEAVEIAVSLMPTPPAVAGDFSRSANRTLTVEAGSTASVGVVTITAVNNGADAPDKTATISGAATGGRGVADPSGLTLTVADDDDAPGVTLSVSPASISENGGTATVTAMLSRTSSADTTITVTAVSGFYTVGTDATIVIAAGQTANAADVALVAASDNDVYEGSGGRQTTVTAGMANDQGTSAVTGAALTLADDETAPTVTLALTPPSISETGEVATVTAALSGTASEAVTVRVSATPGTNAAAADFTQTGTTLTIAAGEMTSAGTVTVAAEDNNVDAPDKSVTVAATAAGGNGVAHPSSVTLTLEDDEAAPTVTLLLSRAAVEESGAANAATVTAALSHPSTEAVTITVTANPVAPAVAGDFTQTGTTLTIAAGATTSAGTVTVAAEDNDVDAPDKRVRVSGMAAGGRGAADPAATTLTIVDNEAAPTVTLSLSSSSISEGGGVATVTATLSGKSGAAVTVTVAAAPGTGAVAADYALSANDALTIAAGATASTGLVTMTAVNNDVAAADKTVTVTGTAAGGHGVANPASVTLTITDNESGTPTGNDRRWGQAHNYDVTTASLLGKTAPQTIAVTAPVAEDASRRQVWACAYRTARRDRSFGPAPTEGAVCRQATGGGWSRTIRLTQAMIDNDGVVVLVTDTLRGGIDSRQTNFFYAEWVPIVALPKATLSLSPAAIWENGGVSTVTAMLDKAAVSATTLTVSVTPAPPALAGDVAPSASTTLTFAAGSTDGTGTVTITGVDNAVDTPDRRAVVRASASADALLPPAVTLTLRDDDAPPTPVLMVSPASISETGGVATVTAVLSHPSSAPTTVTVSAAAGTHAAAADFRQTGAALTIPAGRTESTGTVTITAVGNAADSPDKRVDVSGTAINRQGVSVVTAATFAIVDDDTTPTAALAVMPASIAETGGVATVTATLSHRSSEPVTITVAASPGSGTDFELSTANALIIAAGATASAGVVTITANDDNVDSPDKQVAVSGTASGGLGVANPAGVTLAIRDDDGVPRVSLLLSSSSISENGGTATLTVALSSAAMADVRVLIAITPNANVAGYRAVAVGGAVGTGLTVAAGQTATTEAVVFTGLDNDVDAPNKKLRIEGRVPFGSGVPAHQAKAASLVLVDDEPTPLVSLALSASSIAETGGEATVTATLSGESSEAVMVTVSAAPGGGAAARDFTLSAANTLTIAAGSTTSTGTVTVTAVGNAAVTPDKRVTVSGVATGGNGAVSPSPLALTLEDDDARPTASLVLSSSSISETGGEATVTASLSYPAREAVTITVSATEVAPATSGDFTLSAARTLTIAAGATTSTGLVTVTAVGNNDDAADKQVKVSGTASGGGIASPADARLTIRDDDGTPSLSLVLSPASIVENGGVSTVTATLSGTTSAAVTVTVNAAPGAGAAALDFTLSRPATLTIAAGDVASTGVVTVTANDNRTDSPDKTVTVSGSAAGVGVANPPDAALTLRDDDAAPEVTLTASPASISENGGVSTVTAMLSHPSSAVTRVTVTSVSGAYTVDPPTEVIVIQAGRTENAADVATIFAVDDAIDEPDRQVTVTGTMANEQGARGVIGAALTLTDDDDPPAVTLAVSPQSISENGGVASVMATLSGAVSEAVTVTVTSVPGAYAAGSDATIVIAAGETANASDVATVEAADNADYEGVAGRIVTVTGTASSGLGANPVTGAALTLTDDDDPPAVTLAVSPQSISENGGVASVTATLAHASVEAVTVTVTSVAGDYTAGSDAEIVIAAGATASGDDVATVEAVDNAVHDGGAGRSVTVTGAASSGAGAVTGAALMLTDDETLPTLALSLSPASISESGGVASVTATLSHPSGEAVMVTVAAAPGTGAVAADFDLSAATTLTITAGSTTSTGTVTVTANGNDVDSPDKAVTVSGTAAGGNGVAMPSNVTLTLTDDETLPTVALVLSASSISESSGVSTVTATLSGVSGEAVTVTVSATAGTYAAARDFTQTGTTLTIAAGQTTSTGAVTVRANGNGHDSPNKQVTVSGVVTGGNGAADAADATLTISDDDRTPTVTLFSPTDAGWEGHSGAAVRPGGFRYTQAGQLNFVVQMDGSSELPITFNLGTYRAPGPRPPATAGLDFTALAGRTLTIPPGSRSLNFHVTVLDDDVDENLYESVGLRLINLVNANARDSTASTFIRDDDDAAGLTVVETLGSTRTTEAGGEDRFTVALSSEPTAAVTVAASIPSGSSDEGELSVDDGGAWASSGTLTFTAATWNTAQEVRVRGLDDDADDGDVRYSITLNPDSADATYRGLANVTVNVTNDDDDAAGLTVVESQGSTRTAETGTTDTFTVALSSEPTAAVTVAVASQNTGEGLVSVAGGATAATATLTFDGTTWNTAQTVVVHGQDDAPTNAADGAVRYSITLDPDSAAATATPPGDPAYRALGPVTVSAANLDDDGVMVTLHLSSARIEEDGGSAGAATVTATLAAAATAAVTVTVSATAVAPAVMGDFSLSSANTLTIAAGATASTGVVTIEAVNNNVDAPDKAVTVSATAATGANTPAVLPVTLTIADDDAAPDVTLALSSSSISEVGGVSTVTATLSRPSSAATTITVAPEAGAWTVGSDAAIVIAAGDTANASDVAVVTAVDNLRDENDRAETVTAAVANDQGVGRVTGAALTLRDNDNVPALALANPPSAAEGDAGDAMPGTLTFTVRLGATSGKTVTVDYADAGTGTATSGTDYTALASGTLTFAPGERSRTVTVTVIGDAGNEPDETVSVTLSNPMNATLSEATGTGVIVDDDTQPTLSIAAASVIEGDGGSATLSFPVTLSLASGQTVTVAYAEGTGGTATAGTDYTALAPGTLTFAVGETSKTIDVTVAGDVLAEADETVVVTLSDAENAALGTATGTGTITDDDPAPSVSISSPTVAEGDVGSTALSFAVTLDAVSGRQVTVAWADAGTGTAVSGTDYAALAGGTLTFAPGETSKTIDAAVTGDALDEPNETVVVTLSNAVHAALGTATGTGTITDDDPVPSVSIDSPVVGEGGTLSFAVTLDAASGKRVTVAYAEGTGGTATAGTDYTALASGTLTFAPGETRKTIGVAAWSDTRSEADETVVVVLSGPMNATLGTATGTGTISDDSQPSFAVSQVARTLGINRTFPTFSMPAATGGNGTLSYAMATLPAGLTYTAPGAQDTHGGRITGRPTQVRGATVYRLTATDRDGDVATLNVSIAVSTNPGVERLRITDHLGATVANFRTGGFILFSFDFDAGIATPGAGIAMKFKIGDNEREAEAATFYDTNPGELTFRYQVQASDWDGDGITIPRHPFRLFFDANAGVTGYIRADGGPYHNTPAILDIDVRTPISFTNRPPRINDRAPSFGSATVAAKSFVKGSPVWADDPALPAASFPTPGAGETATDVNSSLTYSLTPALPAGLSFDAAARRITGTPTAAAPAANYTLTATDVDGDRATLTFSLTVQDDTQPAFAADAPAGYTWTEDAVVSQRLPAASGSNLPLGYALAGPGSSATLSLPAGLTFDLDGTGTCGAARTVCGTPTAAAGAATWTLTATDRDGDAGSLAFTITIAPRAPDQVTGVTATPAVNALRVDWTAAAKADGYKVQWKSGSQGYNPATRQVPVSGGATTYTITGLTAGTDYTVRVISTRTGAPDGAASAEAAGRSTDMFLALSRSMIEEDAGAATVTAHLTVALSTAATVTVSAVPGTNAAADDFTLSAANTLIIAAGSTASTGTVTITAVDDDVDSIVNPTVAGKRVVVSGVSGGIGNPAALNLLITEDDDAGLVLNPALPADANDPWLTVAEGGAATFTVALASEPTADATVEVSSDDDGEGQVSSGGGALAASTTLTFTTSNWSTPQTVTLTGAADGAVDGTVDYRLTLDPDGVSGDAYDSLASTTAKARTTDVDAAGLVVSRSALTLATEEGQEIFTLALSSKPAADVTVTITSGSPTEVRVGKIRGGFLSSQTLTFTPGNWSTPQTVGAEGVDDSLDEDDEQVAFTLDPASAGDADYDGLSNVIVTVTVTDDDPESVVSIGAASVNEGAAGAALSFPVTLNAASGRQTTVDYAEGAGGTATAGTDYTALAAGTLTFAAGETTKTIAVAVTDDALDEASETVVVELTGAAGLTLSTTAASATGTISDDDPGPEVSIAGASANEGDDPAVLSFPVTLSAVSGRQTTVDYADAGTGTAASGADYTALDAGTLTFAAGQTAGTVEVAVTQDVADEPDETVVVELTGAAGLTLSTTAASATGTIADDDDPPALSISSPSVAEDAATLSFTVTPSVVSQKTVTVNYADAGTGTATSGTDYTAIAAGTLTLAPGAASGSIDVAVTDDAVNEPDETVIVSLSGAVNASVAPGAAAGTATITDNDAITAQLAVSPDRATEGGGAATVTATISPVSTEAVTITVSPSADFTLAGTTLIVAAGQTAGTGQVTATAVDNATDAPDKRVAVTATASGGNGAVTVTDATLTILDDDGQPAVTLTVAPARIDESGANNVATVTARLSHPSSAATTVTISASPGKDTKNSDFTLTGTKLVIAAGATTSTGRVTVTAVNDGDNTGDKTVTVTGVASNSQGVTIISDPSDVDAAFVVIREDDGVALASLMLSSASIAEAGGVATVTAGLSRTASAAVTITVGVLNLLSPESKDDFDVSANSELIVAAGQTASTGTVTITAKPDNVDSADVALSVSGAIAAGGSVDSPPAVTLTIVDDDATPDVTLAVDPESISEAGGVAAVTATLSGTSAAATTITLTPVPGSYTAGSDATIVIPAGETSNKDDEATLTAVDDDVYQGRAGRDVTVTATVANDVGADDAVTGAALTLNDNDAAPTVTLALTPPRIDEHDGTNPGSAAVTATLSHPAIVATTVTVSAMPGTNAEAGDFTLSAARTLTIAAGDVTSTGTVTITAVDDNVDAPDKQVTVSATASGPEMIAAPSQVTLTIEDDEAAPAVTLVLTPSRIDEHDGTNPGSAAVTATLSHPSSAATTVMVSAMPGTNAEAGDFTLSAARTLTIAAGDTTSTGTVTITAVDDNVDGPDEELTVSGSAANDRGVTDPSDATLTITDDETGPAVTLSVSPSSVAENGGVAMVTATLSGASAAATTITVTSVPGDYTAGSDATIVIPAGRTANASDTATVTAVDNDAHEGSAGRSVTVTASASNDVGVGRVTGGCTGPDR